MTELDRITRDCFRLHETVNVTFVEDELAKNSRSRRGSAVLSEKIFQKFIRENNINTILEVGGNNGRHTNSFLLETKCDVHVFEPNINAISFFAPLQSSPRLHLNFYGLSNTTDALALNIPINIDGTPLELVNGSSTFERILRHEVIYQTNVAMVTTGSKYLAKKFGGKTPEFALWVDVEGHAAEVMEGFGKELLGSSICMCEVEYPSNVNKTGLYGDKYSADPVIRTLENYNHKIIFRDFQNIGQGNIVSINKKFIQQESHLISSANEFISSVSNRFNSSE